MPSGKGATFHSNQRQLTADKKSQYINKCHRVGSSELINLVPLGGDDKGFLLHKLSLILPKIALTPSDSHLN